MVFRLIVILLTGCITISSYAETLLTEQQLISEFENNYSTETNCNQDFVKCVQEKKRAKEKYIKENEHRIKYKSDEEIRAEILRNYEAEKKADSKPVRNEKQVAKKQERTFAETIILEGMKALHDASGLTKAVEDIQENVRNRNMPTYQAKKEEKRENEKCEFWKENQDGTEEKKRLKVKACGY